MVHNNHIKGRANKLYLFNEMRVTDYEENGYYSNPEARYITVRAIGGGRFVEVSRSRIARNGNVVTDQLGANPEPHHHSAGTTVCRGHPGRRVQSLRIPTGRLLGGLSADPPWRMERTCRNGGGNSR